jgi:hypothetical protein
VHSIAARTVECGANNSRVMAGGDGWGFKVRRELVLLCNFENLIDLWTCMNQRKKKNTLLNATVMYSWNHGEIFFLIYLFIFDQKIL